MDHPASLQENPWRSTALVAAGIAALELLLIVVLVFGIVVKPLLDSESGAAPAKKAAAKIAAPAKTAAKGPAASTGAKPAAAELARTKTRVLILNGNGRPGAAGERAAWVRAKGYPVIATANAPRSNFARSLVMYRPGFAAEAKRFGRDFRVRRVAPLDGLAKRDLQGAVVVLILGGE